MPVVVKARGGQTRTILILLILKSCLKMNSSINTINSIYPFVFNQRAKLSDVTLS